MDEFGTFERRGDRIDLRFERLYSRPIETVWGALTDPSRLTGWIGPAIVEPWVGGRYELFIDRPRPMTGRIVMWEPHTLLQFTWDTGDAPASLVRCELTRDGDGTKLAFMHKEIGFEWIALVLPGWHSLLERLDGLLVDQILPNSMQRWQELQTMYLERYELAGVMVDPPPGHGS